MNNFKLSKRSKKYLSGVNKNLIKLIERVIKKSPFDFGIPQYGGMRTAQEQNNLFHKIPKVTQLDGFKKKSYHQTGNAFDIFIFYDGKAVWAGHEEKYMAVWKVIEEEFNSMKVEGIFSENEFIQWGGNWKRFKDYPHFQMKVIL